MNQDKIFKLIKEEEVRQKEKIGLIPSENTVSDDVSQVLSSVLSNKYSEGYPHRRYYEGNQLIDQIEIEAQDRLKKLFLVPYVNVQPYSGSPANTAIQFALMQPGDTFLGQALSAGGHLTHGHPKVTASGRFYNSIQYGLNDLGRIDYDQVEKLALEHQPKVIYCGTTAYPFILDFAKFRSIADKVGAWLVADISHITGLVISGEHPSPVDQVDIVMSTTHKTFRGPRGAMIMVTDRGLEKDSKLARKIDSAIIPGNQGGPHNATTAAIAIAAGEASTPEFKEYGAQIVKNAKALAQSLKDNGIKLVGDGTETHLILIDLSDRGFGLGKQVAVALDVAGIYANANTIPNEPCSPFYPSGLRIGTPLVTSRGMKEEQMSQIGQWIAQVINHVQDAQLPKEKKDQKEFIDQFVEKIQKDEKLLNIFDQVKAMTKDFPLFEG